MNIILQIAPGGYFAARPHVLGLSDDDVSALSRDSYPTDKHKELLTRVNDAHLTLYYQPAEGGRQ